MNTTGLISNWSMAGARSELERSFGSATDILAEVAESVPGEGAAGAVPAPSPLLVRPAGEGGDWQPLVADA